LSRAPHVWQKLNRPWRAGSGSQRRIETCCELPGIPGTVDSGPLAICSVPLWAVQSRRSSNNAFAQPFKDMPTTLRTYPPCSMPNYVATPFFKFLTSCPALIAFKTSAAPLQPIPETSNIVMFAYESILWFRKKNFYLLVMLMDFGGSTTKLKSRSFQFSRLVMIKVNLECPLSCDMVR